MDDWLGGMPKAELHLHLEGAVPVEVLWILARKYGVDREVGDYQAFERRFRYRDFAHFIQTWIWKTGFIREYDDLTLIASAVAGDLARQNIRYVEAFYSPGDLVKLAGLDPCRITEAVRRGLDEHRERVTVALIADLVRDFGPANGERWVRALNEVRRLGLIGIGLGGMEAGHPPEPYAGVYELARSLGFRTTVHAGEAAGPESVWGAVRSLRPDRIGHATRAIEDPVLVEHLRDSRIPIELCPVSNLRTGAVARFEDHPVRRYFDAGLLISINTDDPAMFQTDLASEYRALMETFRFTESDVLRMAQMTIESAWCDGVTRSRLRGELDACGARVRDAGAGL